MASSVKAPIGNVPGGEEKLPEEAESFLGLNFEELLGFQLRLASSASARQSNGIFSELDLKIGQLGILLIIARFPDQTQASISKRLSLDPSSMVPLVDQLERRGYLIRWETTRRAHALRITDQGLEILRQGESRILVHEVKLFTGFSPAERRMLLQLLQRVRENLG